MNPRPVLLGAVVVVLLVGGSFALLPFQVAEHRTSVEGSTGTAVAGNATAEFDRGVDVYVEGPGWVAGAVSHFLVGDLRAAGIEADQIERLENADHPILAVRVLELDASYWPMSPAASAEWRFVYATSGNGTYVREQLSIEAGPVVTTDDERFVAEGQYTLRDEVRGVISVPAYRSGIADGIAGTTAEKVRAAAA